MPVSLLSPAPAQLQAFLESVPLGVAFFDREHRFLQINEAIAEFNGIARDAHIGQRVQDLLPVNAATVVPLLDRVFASGQAIVNQEVAGETPAQPGVRRYWLTGYFPVRGDGGAIDAVGVWCTEISEWRQAEEALRRREAQLRLALASSRTGLWSWNMDTGAATWSPETYEIYGLVPGQFGGTSEAFYPLVHEDDRERVRATLADAIRAGREYCCEFRIHRGDGSTRWVDDRGRATTNADGTTEFLGTVTDITERRSAELELRDSEERFRITFENAAVGISHVDEEGRWLAVNQRMCEIVGYSREQLLATTFQAITHPEDLARDMEQASAVIEGRLDHYSMEKRYLRPDGSEAWTEITVSARRHPDGRFRHFISIVQDISARKRSEQALQAALHASQTGIFRWDIQHDTLTWDDDLDRLFGLRPGEAVRHLTAFLARVHPDDREGVISRCERCRSEGADFEMEFRVIWPDGSIHWLYDRGRTFRDVAGRPAYMTGACVDITSRKKTEEELHHANRMKDEFLATLAHELRNPLAPLRTGIEIVKRSTSRDAQLRAVEVMTRQLGHMVRLVDDLLDVSRIGRGKIELRVEDVDLRAALDYAVESVRPSVEKRWQKLDVSVGDEPVPVRGDLTRLAQVAGNLLNNASKYTPDNGAIRVELRTEDGRAILTVRDDGIGIPDDMLASVFDLFVQVDRSLERSQGGLGIGLSLVKQLVALHGGTVSASSPGVGMGSTFVVSLPLAGTATEPARLH